MIKIKNLKKTFKRRVSKKEKKYEIITAVNNIDLTIKKGEIFGLIGPNGAGKTTTLKILSTLVVPDSGTIKIDDLDIVKDADQIRRKIGLLTGEFARSLYWRLSGFENLKFFAKIKGIKQPERRVNEIIEMLRLEEYKNELVMKYSTGMKHKLALAISLLNDPSVLFLDEPLTGIDPVTAFEIKNLIKKDFKDKTIIWASHNLYEIEEMCDRIALINKGKIIIEGKPESLKKSHWDHTIIIVKTDKPEFFKQVLNCETEEETVKIKTNNVKKSLEEITQISKTKNVEIFDIKTLKPTLEDIFMEGVKDV